MPNGACYVKDEETGLFMGRRVVAGGITPDTAVSRIAKAAGLDAGAACHGGPEIMASDPEYFSLLIKLEDPRAVDETSRPIRATRCRGYRCFSTSFITV